MTSPTPPTTAAAREPEEWLRLVREYDRWRDEHAQLMIPLWIDDAAAALRAAAERVERLETVETAAETLLGNAALVIEIPRKYGEYQLHTPDVEALRAALAVVRDGAGA